MEYEVVVIGGGIGGLTAAAVLARRGVNVCLLERQPYAGGCAALVEHSGYRFEPTHGLYSGWGSNGVFERLFGELAITPPRARVLAMPYLVRLSDGLDIPRVSQSEESVDSLKAAFPECAAAAIEFFRALANPDVANAKLGALDQVASCSPRFRGFIDIQLQALAQCSSAACEPQILASALDPQRLFWEIEGGVQCLVDALVDSFKRSGGKLRLNSAVLRFVFDSNGSPVGVDLLNGERVLARRAIISNLTIWDTYGKLVGPARTPRQVSTSLKATTAFGIYQMFLTLAKSAAAALPAERMLLLTDLPGEESTEPADTQLNFFVPSPVKSEPGDARLAILSAYTNAEDWFSFHEDLSAFEERDRLMLEKLWGRLHSAMPELEGAVELIETATPQTFYENTRRRFGTIGRPTPPLADRFIARPFPNLWLVGDTIADRFGLDGLATSAWETCQKILA